MSSLTSPAWMSRMEERMSPSWVTSSAVPDQPPGAMPPMSVQWPRLAANPTRSPRWKMGRHTMQSAWWVPQL